MNKKLNKNLTLVATIVLCIIAGYAFIGAFFYGLDKGLCASYGHSNTITASLEGYCVKHYDDGTTEYIPVEYMIAVQRGKMTRQKAWRN